MMLYVVLYLWWSVLRRVWTDKRDHYALLVVVFAYLGDLIFFVKSPESVWAALFSLPCTILVFALGWRGIKAPVTPSGPAGQAPGQQ